MRGVAVVVIISLLNIPVVAQAPADLRACAAIQDATERLACFDRAVSGEAPAGEPLMHLEGAGSRQSRPFDVPERWEIRWAAKGSIFVVVVDDETGNPVASLLSGGEPTGSSYVRGPGRVTLDVSAFEPGPWAVDAWPIE